MDPEQRTVYNAELDAALADEDDGARAGAAGRRQAGCWQSWRRWTQAACTRLARADAGLPWCHATLPSLMANCTCWPGPGTLVLRRLHGGAAVALVRQHQDGQEQRPQ